MSEAMVRRGEVALFRFEGALSPRPTLTAATWMAMNARRMRARLLGLSSFALGAPLSARDPMRAARLAWSCLESMSEDRLVVLGELYAEEHLIGSLNQTGLDLLDGCRQRGQRIVLLSDNLDVIVGPVAAHLGVEFIANTMELDTHDRGTGELVPPVLGPELGGRALRERLRTRGIDMNHACGYGSRRTDSVMLGAVALPCAVTPDRELRRLARDLDWPVVEAG
ncbi:MAG: HAD family hydrolase [Sandaracinaceae bacterium]